MHDTEFLTDRAQQELSAAIRSSDPHVREVHLDMADAYLVRLREALAETRRSEFRLIKSRCSASHYANGVTAGFKRL